MCHVSLVLRRCEKLRVVATEARSICSSFETASDFAVALRVAGTATREESIAFSRVDSIGGGPVGIELAGEIIHADLEKKPDLDSQPQAPDWTTVQFKTR